MKQDQEYLVLLNFLARLGESTKGMEFDNKTLWLRDSELIGAKFVMHCGSIFQLARGTKVPNIIGQELYYLDRYSIIVLVRAIYELYLAFNFIYIAPKSDDIKRFRHKVWELGAFLDRQKFAVTEEESIKKLESEKIIVEKLKKEIQTNSVFRTLDANQKEKSLKGEWRLGYHWIDLAEFANFDKEQFRSTYRYLCSYAHTGHLCIFQMQQIVDISETLSLTEIWIESVMGVISHFIYDFIKIYPKSVELFRQYPEAEKLAFIYNGFDRKIYN